MKCEDCEIWLAAEEMNAAVEDHLRECPRCRALAEDLRANAQVFEELRLEELPPVSIKIPRRRWIYGSVAAAAAIAVALLIPRMQPMQPAPVVEAHPAQTQIKVKMLTSDPQVTIYWLLDN